MADMNLRNLTDEQLIMELVKRDKLNGCSGFNLSDGRTVFTVPYEGGISVNISCGDDKWRMIACVEEFEEYDDLRAYVYPSVNCKETEGIVIE